MKARRQLLLHLATLALLPALGGASRPARAAGVQDTVQAMGRYLQAVVGLFGQVDARVDTQVSQLAQAPMDAAARTALRREIQELAAALDRLLAPKGVFVQDLQAYLQRAQKSQFDTGA